jgi:hypothetical protein
MSWWRSLSCALAPACVVACGIDVLGTGPPADSDAGPADSATADAGVDAPTTFPVGDSAAAHVPTLSAVMTTPAMNVDLDTEGTLAWIHWGHNDENSIDEKASNVGALPTWTLIGTTNKSRFTDNLTSFSWNDGTPTGMEDSTKTGVSAKGGTPEFTWQMVAGSSARRLVVYAGLFKATGRFTVTLGGTPTPAPVVLMLENQKDNAYGRVAIDYHATDATSMLAFTWVLAMGYDSSANVTLASMTLAPLP